MGSQARKQIGGAIIGVLLAGLIWLAPTPRGLTPLGQTILAILVLTAVFWVFDVLGNAVTALLMLGLLILAGVKPEHALSAFSGGPFWVLLVVLFYGAAMQSTGLARRLSFWILSWFPPTYGGVMAAFFVIGLALSPAIPAMTVRTAIMVPIAWALVQTLGLPSHSRGSALLVLSSIEMAVAPGCATLYGSLWGPVMVQLFQTQGYRLEWWDYTRALALPTLVWSLLLLLGNWLALRPEQELNVSKEFAKTELAKLGKLSRPEIATAVIITVSIAYWVGEHWHHRPSYLIGLFGLAAFAACGVLRERDFGNAISWPFLLFLGAMFGLPTVVQQNKVTDWLAGFIVPAVQSVAGNVWALLMVMAIAMLLLKFMDPTGFLAMTVLFLPISTILRDSPVSPLVLIGALLLAGHPFWVTYQSIWVAMGEGLTGNRGFDGAQRVRLAHVHAAATLLALSLSIVYWRALALLP